MSVPRFNAVGKTKLTILRGSQGKYVNGEWTSGDVEEINILANVQPASYKETMILAEADRTRETIKIFSCSEIRGMREGTNGWDADTFVWNGDVYEIMKVKRYQMGVLDSWQCLACLCPLAQEV